MAHQGWSRSGRINTTVARPGRSKVAPSLSRPIDDQLTMISPMQRSADRAVFMPPKSNLKSSNSPSREKSRGRNLSRLSRGRDRNLSTHSKQLAEELVENETPDLILSGINHGSNTSISVLYSGTMSAAIEGALEGIPSIGFSLCNWNHEGDFQYALPFIESIIKKALDKGLKRGIALKN